MYNGLLYALHVKMCHKRIHKHTHLHLHTYKIAACGAFKIKSTLLMSDLKLLILWSCVYLGNQCLKQLIGICNIFLFRIIMLINIYIFSLQNLQNLKWHHISFTFADQNFKQFLKYVILIFMELINR